MGNENETFQTSHSDDIRQKIARMGESVELARSDIRRTKNEIEQYHNAHASHVRRTRALWVLVILLLAGVAGFSWYASPLLSEHRGLLGRMPVLQSALDNVGGRVASTEEQAGAWANDRSSFSNQLSKIEQKVGSNLKTLRNEARLMMQQIKYETGQSLQALQNRVAGVESIQREHTEEVAKLRNELVGVRQDLANVKEENIRQANHISQVEQAHQSTRNDLSGLDRRLSSNQTAVSSLAYQVDRKRVDFELQNGRTEQVVDGIYMTIKNTDVERQRIDGWVQIASDGRFVWLRGESAQHPIDFSSRADARAYQLVFTQVGRTSAAGYVLVPTTATASDAAN
jgi:capsule polysaccharide export protein KpsE/RkpR